MSVKKLDESKLSARAKAAAVALAELQRAVRFYRLYPHDHPLCAGSVTESLERLNRFLERQGALEVEVQRDGLYLDEELVLRDSEQSSDLSALLFPEGIREVSIDAGIPLAELAAFTEILATHYPEGTEEISFTTDLLTELWRRDFSHIEYRIYDQLAPTSVTTNRDPTVAPVAERIVDLVDRIGGKPGADGQDPISDGLDVDRFLAELDKARDQGELDDLANWATRPEKVDEFLSSQLGSVRRELLLELSDAHKGDPLGRALDVVVWAAPSADGPAVDDVARFVAGSTLAALARSDVERATATLSRLPEGSPQADEIQRTIAARLGTDQALGMLATALQERQTRLTNAALVDLGVRYLSRLDRSAVDGACQLYSTLEVEPVRRVFREFLASHIEDGAAAIAAITTRVEDRRIVEEVATLLASAGRESEGWRLLQAAAGDTLHTFRAGIAQEVIDTVTGEKLRRERAKLLATSESKEQRLEALQGLAERAGPRLFDELSPIALEADFVQRDEDEVIAVLDLLVKVGGLRAVRVLQELSGRKAALFGRREVARVAALAKERLDDLREHR